MDWIHPWIGLDWVEFWRMLRGLGWIGSNDCYVQNFDGLCFQAKQTKAVLCYNSDFCISIFHCFFHFLVFTDGAYCIVVPITGHRHVTLHF